MTRRTLALAALAITLLLAAGPPDAHAGEYPVYACEPAYGDVNHAWLPETTTSTMASYSNCPVPWSESREWNRGLVTLHPISGPSGGQTVNFLSFAALRLQAPPGASLSRMTYAHTFCGGGSFMAGLVNEAGQWLHAAGPRECGTLVPNPWTLQLGGTPSVRLATTCVQAHCNTSGDERAWASMRSATVWIADSTAPSVQITGGSLVDGAWHRGTQSLTVAAQDNVGVKHVEVFLDDKRSAAVDGSCDWTYTVPCYTSIGSLGIESPIVPDGEHTVTASALDSAGNWGSTTARALVDNSAPPGPLDLQVDGGDGWKAGNDFGVSWTEPGQKGTAPISAVEWAICPAANAVDDDSNCSHGTSERPAAHALTGLHAPAQGNWVGRFWLRDAAGNTDSRTARSVSLRYDPTAPDVSILAEDPSDPQRLDVAALDALSGLTRVDVEVRRDSDDAWRSLPVEASAGGFIARIDDAALPRGHYLLRARAIDAAGNERTTELRGGAPATLDLPLRLATRFSLAGIRTVKGKHGRRRTVRRRTPTAAFGAPVPVRGRLTLPGGNPLGAVDVEVFEQTALPGAGWRRIGLVRTGIKGRFSYKALPGPSRRLRFAYAGTPLIQPRSAQIRLRVRANTSFDVNHAHVVNGDEVLFRGRVRGRIPHTGKLLQLQAYSRGTWRTFATPRAAVRSHRWRYRYRFSATRGIVRYRFRALVPPETGFPYVRGASRSLRVTVRGL